MFSGYPIHGWKFSNPLLNLYTETLVSNGGRQIIYFAVFAQTGLPGSIFLFVDGKGKLNIA